MYVVDPTDTHPSDYGVFRPRRIAIRPESVLRLHGYKDPAKVRPVIRRTAEAIAERAHALIAPEVHHRRFGVAHVQDGILTLDNGLRFSCPAFGRHLNNANAVVVVVTTMGARLDEAIQDANRRERSDPLEALFLENCGWLAVEQTTKRFGDTLRARAKPLGERVSSRMAPGYTYRIDGREVPWPLEEQRQIFRAFQGIDLPVRLLESCAMLPKMSRSGLYGLVPET